MRTNTLPLSSTNIKSGFTMVELLVTIAILMILAALIFIGSSRMYAIADRTRCVENLRQLQIANGVYAINNNGTFVSTFTQSSEGKTGGLWDRNPDFLDIYLGDTSPPTNGGSQESRVKPKHLDPIAYKAQKSGYATLKASYGMVSKENYKSGNKDVDSVYRTGQLTAPAQTAAFVTAVNWLVQYGGRDSWDGEEGKVNAPRIAYRYKNKALVVYYDGHVGEITKEDMAELDRRGGRNNAFWKGLNGEL